MIDLGFYGIGAQGRYWNVFGFLERFKKFHGGDAIHIR